MDVCWLLTMFFSPAAFSLSVESFEILFRILRQSPRSNFVLE